MSLSQKEELFLLTMEEKGQFVFESVDAQIFWGSPANTANALSRLTHKQWLERLSRGVYLIRPLESRGKPFSQETRFLIASHLTSDAVLAYQSAMDYYGMTDGTYNPKHYTIQTTHRKQSLIIQDARYQFITVSAHNLQDSQSVSLDSHGSLRVSTLEKTLVDSALRPDLCSGIFNGLQFLRQFTLEFNWGKIDQILKQPSNAPALKRIGYLVDKFKIDIPEANLRLNTWSNHLSQGIIRLEPKSLAQGHIHTHWAIEDNCFEKKEGELC